MLIVFAFSLQLICIFVFAYVTVADLEGVLGVHSNPPPVPNYFIFMANFKGFLCEIRKTNPTIFHLNPFF